MPFVGTGHLWSLLLVLLVVVAIVAIIRRSSRTRSLLMVAGRRECPACKEWMRRDASICPHCRTPSDPWTFHDGRWWVVRANATYYLDEASQTWERFDPPPPPS
jgi:hypothetical protein